MRRGVSEMVTKPFSTSAPSLNIHSALTHDFTSAKICSRICKCVLQTSHVHSFVNVCIYL